MRNAPPQQHQGCTSPAPRESWRRASWVCIWVIYCCHVRLPWGTSVWIQLLYHYALPDATCYSMLFFYLNYHHWSSLNLNENNYKNGSTFGMTITWICLTTSYQLSKPSLPHLGIPSGSGWPSSYVAFIGPTRKPDKGAWRESPAMADSG